MACSSTSSTPRLSSSTFVTPFDSSSRVEGVGRSHQSTELLARRVSGVRIDLSPPSPPISSSTRPGDGMSPLLSNAQSFQNQLHRHSRQSSTCSGNDTLSASSSSTSSSSSPFPALLKAFNPQEVQVEVECEPAAIGDRVLLRSIIIHNMSKLDLDDSLTLTAEPNDLCFLERVLVGSLARGQRKVVPLQLRVRSSLTMPYEDAIPERYVLTLSHASPSSLPPSSASSPPPDLEIRYSFENSFRYFLKGLPGLAPRRVVSLPCPSPPSRPPSSPPARRRLPAPCNLVLVGPAGAGKSTLLAHLLTLVSEREHVNLGGVRTCATSSHGTLELRAYPLHPTVSAVSVWDTRGFTPSTYTCEELANILAGDYPERRWDPVGRDAGREAEVREEGGATRALREQQACVVVLPEGILQSAVELDQLRRQLELVQRAGLNPLVLLTHVDLAYPSLRADPSGRGVGELGEARREAARQLGVEANRVLHMVPYKDEETRRFSIDRLVYKVLAKALQLAAEYVESHPEGAREEGPGQEAVPLRSLFGVSHAWPAFLEAEDSAPDALQPYMRGGVL
ncbi:hypothetical protein Naga_100340g8 [Nannochloropsis gaditana]|uniref:Uncharacterized protein n=1 Tax=Nannochloropsis gaditana TaxID=72520 RepID=W7TGP1_9STRA|nr:hypothetical protein Naga_100340g8 [Nannochloropsis gaditana]